MPIGDYDLAADLDQMSLDAARACQIWLCLPDRSWATLATTTGDNENTVRSWAKRYRWKEVAARYDQSLSASLLGTLRSVIIREAFNSVKVAIEIRDDEGVKPGNRLKAATWIASLGGLGPRSAPAVPDVENGVSAVNADGLRKLATSGDPEDLKRLVRLTTGRAE